jgi:3'(2'), 5'-bisphosphate nucleotidase
MTEKNLLKSVVAIARDAGAAVMDIYENADFDVKTKKDDESDFESPLTKADLTSNEIIEKALSKISDYPVLSEEGEQDVGEAKRFWLVDPLDGTKEFIKKNGEFTVNIALIEDRKPILGVVYAPAKDLLYAADESGAYKVEKGKKTEISATYKGKIPTVIVSRSHRDERTQEFLDDLGEHKEITMGSSLKLCLVAEGKASLYPRLAPTYTWDTAAADAIVRAAGGSVKNLGGQPLNYPTKAQKNPFFVVRTKD